MLGVFDAAFSWAYGLGNALLIRLEYPAATCAIFLALELALPRQRNSWSSYWRGAKFVAVSVAINTMVLTLLTLASGIHQVSAGTEATAAHQALAVLDLRPLTTSENVWLRVAGLVAATFGIAAIADAFGYWLHRAQHRFAWLWRFHRVHHSIVEMNATNSYHHFTEDFFQFVAITVPMSVLLGVEAGPVPWLVIVVNAAHATFIHSSARINIGPLRYIFSDNLIHRIHHSVESHHRDRNFGAVTPIWDMLFGTAYFPRRDEWPAVGLDDMAEPRTVRQWLMMPLRA